MKKDTEKNVRFLMIRRKNTFGYIDFIRGKYSPFNKEHLQNIINQMSIKEKNDILNESFSTLWKKMWGETANTQHKNEEMSSSKKIDLIKNGVIINDVNVTLEEIIKNSNTNWEET